MTKIFLGSLLASFLIAFTIMCGLTYSMSYFIDLYNKSNTSKYVNNNTNKNNENINYFKFGNTQERAFVGTSKEYKINSKINDNNINPHIYVPIIFGIGIFLWIYFFIKQMRSRMATVIRNEGNFELSKEIEENGIIKTIFKEYKRNNK